MSPTDPATPALDAVLEHFTKRAGHYDRSSRWCTDPALAEATVAAVAPGPADRLLDVAVGTGLVSRAFRGRVAHITGLDVTPAMFEQARPHVDVLVQSPAERLPFAEATFDAVVCRQGSQFMDDVAAFREMLRVVKPGGRVVIVNLCAYGEEDAREYFEVLRLRNPARRNFYTRASLASRLRDAGAQHVEVRDYVSVEDVDAWADNKAIEDSAREAIRQVYAKGSAAFLSLHGVEQGDGQIIDRMLFGVAVATR